MANVDRPNGFTPVKYISGAPYNGAYTKYYSDSDNLFLGDLVEQDTAGQAGRVGGAYPTCDRVDNAGDTIQGVVVGWEVDPAAPDRKYHAASTTYAVYVADARNLVMEAQSDDATMVVGDIGLNCSPTVTAGSTSTGLSNMEISGSSAATTSTLTLKIVGAVDRPDNDASDSVANQRWLVTVNEYAFSFHNTGV